MVSIGERREIHRKFGDRAFGVPERLAYPLYTTRGPSPGRARSALSRSSRFATPTEREEICRKVGREFPDIHARSCPTHREPAGVAAAERGR